MKKIILFILFSIIAGGLKAQTMWDGLRYTQNMYEGTARFTAMGGAFAALGGDFTSLSINPAGIGVYRGSEIIFAPIFTYNNTETDYLGKVISDSHSHISIGNLGVIFGRVYGDDGLVSFNWGTGYNKLHNVLSGISAGGISTSTSFLSSLADDLTGIHVQDIESSRAFDKLPAYWPHILAWDTHLLDLWDDADDIYLAATEHAVDNKPVQSGALKQSFYSEETGNTGEYVFSLGGNVSNRFYFGATFGLQSIRNEYYQQYSEEADNINDFNQAGINETLFHSYTHKTQLNTEGEGYNIKLGFIARPVAGLRIGGYFHSPTWMYLSEEYLEQMDSYVSGDTWRSEVDFSNEYKIITPIKYGIGIAYTFGSVAVLSAEYEGIDYPNLKMYDRENEHYVKMLDVDSNVFETFTLSHNVRAGAEYRLNRVSFRAGYAWYGSPLKQEWSDEYFNYEYHTISAGIGYRWNNFFIDSSYSYYIPVEEKIFPYFKSTEIKNTNFTGKFNISFGYRF